MKTALLGFLAAGLLPMGEAAPVGGAATLYFFFSPETTGAEEVAFRATEYVRGRQGATFRPVLLVEDFNTLRQVGEESPITKAVREMGGDAGVDIPLYDEEGLRLAEAWHITRLPALILVQGGRAHACFGTRVDPKELEECK